MLSRILIIIGLNAIIFIGITDWLVFGDFDQIFGWAIIFCFYAHTTLL